MRHLPRYSTSISAKRNAQQSLMVSSGFMSLQQLTSLLLYQSNLPTCGNDLMERGYDDGETEAEISIKQRDSLE